MASVETRNLNRESLFLFAEVSVDGGAPAVRVKVRNLSPGGMMAEGACLVETGQRLVVELRNIGPVLGTVAWVQGNRFGIAFDATVDPRQVRMPVVAADSAEAPRYARPAMAAPMFDANELRIRNL